MTEWDTHSLAMFLQSRKMEVWSGKLGSKVALLFFDVAVSEEHYVKCLQSWMQAT